MKRLGLTRGLAGKRVSPLLFLVLVDILRRGIELPAVAIAIGNLGAALQLFVIVVLDAQGAADVVDDVLIGSGVVAAGGFVANGLGGFPVGIDVT